MRFELAPDNRGADNETLLKDLRRVARDLGKDSLSQEEYNHFGRFHSATVKNRIGWNKALELASLRVRKQAYVPRDKLLADVRRVATDLNKSVLTIPEYRRFGRFPGYRFHRFPGGWPATLKEVGLCVSAKYHEKSSDEQLFKNLEAVWRTLGKQPRGKFDMRPPLSKIGYTPYIRRFGSWRKALEAFVDYVNRGEAADELGAPPASAVQSSDNAVPSAAKPVGRTPRAPSWRLRFLVMRRDNFKCRLCGASPSVTPGVVLVLDHVEPWAKGGKTIFENLQTLCEPCNGGKSDLLIDGEE
jgi:hypothetical protein